MTNDAQIELHTLEEQLSQTKQFLHLVYDKVPYVVFVYEIPAVSYTHLDVYKRQSRWGRSAALVRRRRGRRG